ncbi:Glycosyl transferase, family 2 [Fimbriiglobus ruber]|uniref:Glycosyl transferase, family 2 n=1 Tax=Fimbriiglobus ruber TaxID=1908690 RepID=A0A225EEZ6_9BACT|nr:Glycosyl transferase, family 2 [Fimbriiglobus ruber]
MLVVNGPSTDDTDAVLAEFTGSIRVYRCAKARLSVSRNIGLAEASGDVVAFIDDDAIPTPHWMEELAAAYCEPGVGAVGGLVYDQTGVKLQYRFAACHRDGRPTYQIEPPLDQYLRPYADPVAYLQGTNMSYRRTVLREIGGFDENILHYYDDVDTCLHVVDKGHKLIALEGAAVHHKFLASHIRNHNRIVLDPFNQLSDRIYFAFRHGRATRTLRELMDGLLAEADQLRKEADNHVASGAMTAAQQEVHHRRLEEALEVGLNKGLSVNRAGREVPPARASAFLPFPTVRPTGSRLKLCFISNGHSPSVGAGELARHTHELATGLGNVGHEIHVVTRSPDIYRLDFEHDVWVHRIPDPDRFAPELDGIASKNHLFGTVGVYHEVCKIHANRPVDLVSTPLLTGEGLVCGFDNRFPTITTFATGPKAFGRKTPAGDVPAGWQGVAVGDELATAARALREIDPAKSDGIGALYPAEPSKSFVAGIGLRDRFADFPRRRTADGRVRVLCVFGSETAVDLVMEAAGQIGHSLPNVEFVIASRHAVADFVESYHSRVEDRFATDPGVRERVTISNPRSSDELYQEYADCDVVHIDPACESFGQTVAEATMFGKPVVSARNELAAAVLTHGEQAYLIPSDEIASLADALRELVSSPGLRRQYGERARELYRQRFSRPVLIARCERHFRAMIAHHRRSPGWNPTNPVPPGAVSEGFTAALIRAGLPPERAGAAASRLLDARHHPVDLPLQFGKFWHLPAAEFIAEAFRFLFNRAARPDEITEWLGEVRRGLRRIDLIRLFIESAEGRRAYSTDCIQGVADVCGAGEFVLERTKEVVPPAPPLRPTLRHRLSGALYVGMVLRYCRRALYLPWNFHKFYQEFENSAQIIQATRDRQAAIERLITAEILPMLQTLAVAQEQLRALIRANETAVVVGHERIQSAMDVQTARIGEAIGMVVAEMTLSDLDEDIPQPRHVESLRRAG